MRGLMLLADGFEDVEALAPRDILIRGGVEVVTASIFNKKEVITSHGVHLFTDILLEEVNSSDFDFVILPGGGRGTQNLLHSDKVINLVKEFAEEDKLVCAICAAPMVLGKAGLLKDKRFTCYKGCNEGLEGVFTGGEVVKDGNIITARSMLYSVPFGLKILESLLGEDIREKIYNQINGL